MPAHKDVWAYCQSITWNSDAYYTFTPCCDSRIGWHAHVIGFFGASMIQCSRLTEPTFFMISNCWWETLILFSTWQIDILRLKTFGLLSKEDFLYFWFLKSPEFHHTYAIVPEYTKDYCAVSLIINTCLMPLPSLFSCWACYSNLSRGCHKTLECLILFAWAFRSWFFPRQDHSRGVSR